ncbi:Piwi domain-containing protein, partial [Phakopsora pachyrhizi]
VKTHRIRFERHPSDTDRSGISQPGTIVDKFIGDPFLYNFFIQSQAILIGTSCPSRYIALKDEINHTVDDLQKIANLVSSGFQRAPKSVEIATPTYYANLVATSAKKWNMSDANGSTAFTTNSGAQTPVKRQNEFYYFRIGLMR